MKSLTDMSLAVAQLLKQRGETVAVAETSTGGLISSALLAVPGASAYYKGGSVIYTLESRKQLLGIGRSQVEGLEPMTEAMALRFAEVARAQLKATWSIAELGIALCRGCWNQRGCRRWDAPNDHYGCNRKQ